jgi:D-alanyl-lipoteichoic acid acyltransferase DltB (MBOAT superfamily)
VLAANWFFCARWSWVYLAVIPLCSLIDYWIGRGIAAGHRWLISLSLLMNLGLIVSTKLPTGVSFALPLSLSFYAFQALTYTIDIFRKDAKPAPNWLTYAASVSFFPTILAGPITRVSTLVTQWAKFKLPLSNEEGGRALFLIGMGFAKKLLIADYLGEQLVNRVFDTPTLYSGLEVLLGVYGYAFQLYYDFSGYTDIALGSALLLGFKLPANFNRPYEATNVADFWRRWHISFSNWLRDYLYFSLPGARGKALPYLNLVITMLFGGLWHGLNWTFLVWGAWHGLGLAMARFLRNRGDFPRWLAILLTFHFVLIGWIFFRADSLGSAWTVLNQISSFTLGLANVSPGFAGMLALAATLHYLPGNWYTRVQQTFTDAPALAQAAALLLLALSIQHAVATGAAPFVYQRF